MAAVLGAQTQGETHRQNDTSLAGRPKDTNPYPGRDPYRGIHKGGRREARPPLVEESQPSGLSGPHAHAPCRLKVSLSLKLRCRAPQLPPAALSGLVKVGSWPKS